MDATITPGGVLPSPVANQPPDVAVSGGPAGSLVFGLVGPAAPHDVAIPPQHGLRRDEQLEPGSLWVWHDGEQDCEPSSVCPRHPQPGRLLARQHRQLMTQQHDLGGLPRLLPE